MLNQTIIENIETISRFYYLSHQYVVVPNLVIFYILYLFFFLVFGLIVANKESRKKFWALYISTSIVLGALLLTMIFIPSFYRIFFNIFT